VHTDEHYGKLKIINTPCLLPVGQLTVKNVPFLGPSLARSREARPNRRACSQANELAARDACQLSIRCRNMTDKRFLRVFASSRFIHALYGACVARMNQSLVEQAQHSRASRRYYASPSVKLSQLG